MNNNFEQRLNLLYEARNKLNIDLQSQLTEEEIRDYENFGKLFKDILEKSNSILTRGINKIELKEFIFHFSSERLIQQKLLLGKYFLPKKKWEIKYKPLEYFLNQLSEKSYGYSVGVTPTTPVSILITILPVNPEINEVYWADNYGQKMSVLEQWLYW